MDLSKLPRFSQTPTPPNDPAPESVSTPGTESKKGAEVFCRCGAPLPAGTRFCSHCGASYREATGDAVRGAGGDDPVGGMWIEAFISIAVGLFLLLMMPNGIKYRLTQMSGQPFKPYAAMIGEPPETRNDFERFKWPAMVDPATGAVVAPERVVDIKYVDRFEHYWADTAITFFALALILNGIVIGLLRNRWAILAAALLLTGATLLNVWYVGASFSKTNPLTNLAYGFAPFQMLAAIFGVVMAAYQFRIYSELSRRRA
ncbi:MAG: zinc ribbon domain-containing protein [Phycisphaerae bacterium]|nr:zinc ribbon domain-containing protein [Tepidisphaeraceae bacterium]